MNLLLNIIKSVMVIFDEFRHSQEAMVSVVLDK